MPDSWRITGPLWGIPSPGPTTLELASFCIAEEGIDFDAGALFQNQYVQNPARDGGQLAFSQTGIRKFSFPLRLASSWPGPGGLSGIEDHLRRLVRAPNPGYIELLPEGETFGGNPSSAIRFDIVDGHLNWRTYNVYRQRAARRDLDLVLDVQPFGYLPTMITLASAGMATTPFQLPINAGSIIGDIPGLAEITIRATMAQGSPLVGSTSPAFWAQDAIWWSLSRPNGATPLISPSRFFSATLFDPSASTALLAISHLADAAAPLGVTMRTAMSPTTSAQWRFIALASIGPSHVPPYRGRQRLLAYFRCGGPSYGIPWQVTADESAEGILGLSRLASAYPVATVLPPGLASSNGVLAATYSEAASGMFQVVDLGEHTWPPIGSGLGGERFIIRLWAKAGTSNLGVASPQLDFGGLWTVPLDTMAGFLPRGLIQPTYYNVVATDGGGPFQSVHGGKNLYVDGVGKNRFTFTNLNSLTSLPTWESIVADMRPNYYGPNPEVATNVNLDVGVAGRLYFNIATSQPGGGQMMHSHPFQVSASVRYQPRFSFLRGL